MGLEHRGSRVRSMYVCAITTTIFFGIAVVVAIALGFTVFRPRDPNVAVYMVGLKDHSITDFVFAASNVSTAMIISINNGNYVGFKYDNATSLIRYNGMVVGEVRVEGKEVAARSQVNVTTTAVLMAPELMAKSVNEISSGKLNLTSSVTLHGRSTLLGVKVRASAHTECNMTLVLGEVLSGNSSCWSRLKIE